MNKVLYYERRKRNAQPWSVLRQFHETMSVQIKFQQTVLHGSHMANYLFLYCLIFQNPFYTFQMVVRKTKGKITNAGLQNHIKFKLGCPEIGLKVYWTWTCPSEQDPVSPSDSFSHEEASICLSSLSFRGQTA